LLIYYLLATTLANDLITARKLYIAKRDHFQRLSQMHPEQVGQWTLMDRRTSRVGKNEARSVYKHNKTKGLFIFERTFAKRAKCMQSHLKLASTNI
jgi:hypothetical protein